MTEKHFIISLCEDMTVKAKQGTINRNSNSTQYLDVELDGWKLNEGEDLYIELSHYNPDTELTTNVGPLHLVFVNELKRYVTLAPPELVNAAGQWSFSVELRFNISENEDGELTYNSLTSAIGSLTVIDTVMTASPLNSYSKEAELLTAAKKLTDAILAGYSAEEALSAARAALQSETNAALSEANSAAAQVSAQEAALAAKQSEISAQASAASATEAMEEATLQAENAAASATAAQNAQTVATEQATAAASSAAQASASGQNAANSAADAESAKSAAALSATEAHGWADIAKQWADYGIKINTEYTSLDRLPNPGDSHFIYLISNGSTGENSYDEYIWADAKSAYEKIGTTEIDLTSYATKAEVNYGLNTKLDKSGGEVAGDITVNGCLNARNITAEQILGRGEVPIIEQNPRMFAINFGNIYNEMRLSGKSKRPVYIAWDKNSDSKYPECADEREIAFISDVDQKVNKSGDTMTGKLVLSELLITQHGNSSIEINPDASMPYIDFHYGDDTGTTEDYNVRLINDADGQLTCKGKFTVDGNITVNSYKTTVLDYFDMITGDGTNFGFTGASGNIYRLQEMYSPNNPPNAKALLAAYPIGAIYISTNSTSPASIFGGAWTVITEGYYLKAVTSGAGSYEIAGLPNITGSFLGNSYTSQSNYTSTGAFYNNGTASGASGTDKRCISNFNASRSSSVYGRSETVTPNNYSVYMWRRTA